MEFKRCDRSCKQLVSYIEVGSGVRRIFQWRVSVTSHHDDVKILQLAYSSSEVLKCIGL